VVVAVLWTVFLDTQPAVGVADAQHLQQRQVPITSVGVAVLLLAVLVVYRQVVPPITTLSVGVRSAATAGVTNGVVVRGPAQLRALAGEINALVAAEARQRSERAIVEEMLRESLSHVKATDEERRRLLAKLVTAQEEERRRIASDVHDDSIQVMTAVVMRLGMLRLQLSDPAIDGTLVKLESTVQESINRLRQLLFQLRPPALDREGLLPALREYMEQWAGEISGLEYQIQAAVGSEPPPQTRAILFRIAQEALTNVRKHAHAKVLSLTLQDREEGVHMTIEDDGLGFRTDEKDDTAVGHLGLVSMRERAELAGGWWQIRSSPGAGTKVECWIPSERSGPSREEAMAAHGDGEAN
jgi:signal transduction histidine kinase